MGNGISAENGRAPGYVGKYEYECGGDGGLGWDVGNDGLWRIGCIWDGDVLRQTSRDSLMGKVA
jgi:hypothetical protein